jgi:alpha-L-fucosidase 2
MKKEFTVLNAGLLLLWIILMLQTSCSGSGQNSQDKRDMVVWYNKPADKVWLDGLFIGNGYMGANVFGKVKNERIALNESTFWSGKPHDYNDPDAGKYFGKIKDLVFADKFAEAEKMADERFYGKPGAQQAYQPIGDLILNFNTTGDSIRDYHRELDMETGVVKVTYTEGNVKMTREVFMSYPNRVMVMKVSANKPGRVSLEAKLKSPFLEKTTAKDGKLSMNGTWKYLPGTVSWLIARVEGTGLRFQTSLVALPEKGTLESTDSSLVVTKANSVTFILTTATSFINYKDISGDPAATCAKIMAGVNGKDFNTLKETHLKDFMGLMGRVHLKIGDPLMNQKPTDERVTNIKNGLPDPDLLAKIFQFGRYILVSSSRVGSEPANLQGRWNQDVLPNWGSKYTININTEMNYWPAEVTNLSETHMPLFNMIKDLAENGAKTAKLYYNAGGWVAHHNTDLWRGTAPVDAAKFGMWPVGGTWLCQHIWEHYLFTGDVEFLREYYPIMKGSAQFLMDIMTIEPKHKWLVIPFSMSPEQGYFVKPGAKEAFLSSSTTMDVGMVRDLFPHCIEAGKILNIDQEFSAKLTEALGKIPPYQIGKDGLLQVWIEDWIRGTEGHNMSANFGFYPGNSITLRGNPEIAAAIEKWLEPRPVRTSWTSAWDICDWARLENGEKIDTVIKQFFTVRSPLAGSPRPGVPAGSPAGGTPRPGVSPGFPAGGPPRGGIGNNFQNTSSNQSDANYGFTAGVAEALLQSHAGEISLLPALPSSWKDGSVTGLRARGGFEVSMEWKEGKLTFCIIKSLLGNPLVVRCNGKTTNYTVQKGESVTIKG